MSNQPEHVVLVDERDAPIGTAEKQAAHTSGALHRAFSVFVLNSRGEFLLQCRADGKYHSGGLWSNTCCGHPRPGEETAAAARRRLREEMGFECDLVHLFGFLYRAELGGGMTEHEYDHVFVGHHDGDPDPDPSEVSGWRWTSRAEVEKDVILHPSAYTPWFRMALLDLMTWGIPAHAEAPPAR